MRWEVVGLEISRIGINRIEVKTVGELIDELITTSNRIYHLVDEAVMNENGDAALQAQKLNVRRNKLIIAINGVLNVDNIESKVFLKED